MNKKTLDYKNAYAKSFYTGVCVRFNCTSDAKVIKRIQACPNRARYIKELIRKDICAGKNSVADRCKIPRSGRHKVGKGTYVLGLKYHIKYDADIIRHLHKCTNVTGYIRELVQRDIELEEALKNF